MKKATSFYMSEETQKLMNFLVHKEDTIPTRFIDLAIRAYLDGDHSVDERILITKKSDPRFIKKTAFQTYMIDESDREELKAIALDIQAEIEEHHLEGMGCNMSQLLFWAVMQRCSKLAEKYPDEIMVGDESLTDYRENQKKRVAAYYQKMQELSKSKETV